jgi:hypothetical protein
VSDATHTAGPWACHSYAANGGKNFGIETADHRHGIAAIRPNDTASTMLSLEEHEANARLIAAAPDLLAACQAVAGVFEDYEDKPLYAQKCIAALTLARGGA